MIRQFLTRFYVVMSLCGAMMIAMPVTAKAANAANAVDPVTPDPSIAAVEVVAIQLKALQFNDNPMENFGILQTWQFAHPRNRAMTGPLPRFAAMLQSMPYGTLLNHNSHKISPTLDTDSVKQFDVLMETQKGRVLLFQWTVEKVTSGEFADCWMTVGVTAPSPAGLGS